MAYMPCPRCGTMKHQLVACPNCGFSRTIHAKDPAGRYRARTGSSTPTEERRPGVKVIVRRKKVLQARMPSNGLHSGHENGE